MSEELMVTKSSLERKLGSKALGSLRELVKRSDLDDTLLLVDCSGSMGHIMETGQRSIDALRQIVADVLKDVKVSVAAFGSASGPTCYVQEVPEPCGSTPLHDGIQFATREKKKHLVVISDGCPDSPEMAMSEAKAFGGRVDAIYVGDDGTPGAKFMAELAHSTGGSGSVGDLKEMKLLKGKIMGLLGDGTKPKGAIQL